MNQPWFGSGYANPAIQPSAHRSLNDIRPSPGINNPSEHHLPLPNHIFSFPSSIGSMTRSHCPSGLKAGLNQPSHHSSYANHIIDLGNFPLSRRSHSNNIHPNPGLNTPPGHPLHSPNRLFFSFLSSVGSIKGSHGPSVYESISTRGLHRPSCLRTGPQ